MQILITHGSLARTRVLRFNRWQLGAALFGLIVVLTLLSGTVYNFVFLKAARGLAARQPTGALRGARRVRAA